MANYQLENEVHFLLQLSKGSEIAFETIYKHYSPHLYRKLINILKTDVIAQEVLQDVFIIIWKNRENIDVSKCFYAYLSCIVVNKCYDYFRKISNEKKMYSKLNNVYEYSPIEEGLINKESLMTLYQVIELLPPKRKLIFSLCKVDGKSYEEVSQQLGVSLSTISDHIVKANHFIRNQLLHTDI